LLSLMELLERIWSGLGVSKLVVGSDVQRDWANGIWVLDSIRVEGH
jgi:hypothetical protein